MSWHRTLKVDATSLHRHQLKLAILPARRRREGREVCAPKDLNASTLQNFTIELLPTTSTSRTALPSIAHYQSSTQSSLSVPPKSAPPTAPDSSHPPPPSTGPPPSS